MLSPCLSLRTWTLPLGAGLLGLAFAARAAQTPAASPSPAAAKTNAAPAEPEPPKSAFIIPASPQEGKDPFFPQSTRLFKVPIVPPATTGTNPPAVVVELLLKGVSGAANRRLAIINNRTFETGEEGEVTSSMGPVRITCKEINADSVRVLVNGQERTLRLRPGS
jgi:hypothetical protein